MKRKGNYFLTTSLCSCAGIPKKCQVRRLCSPRTANLLPGAKKCEAESLSTAVATLYLTNNDQLWDPSKNIGECIAYERSPGVDNVQYIWLIKPDTLMRGLANTF